MCYLDAKLFHWLIRKFLCILSSNEKVNLNITFPKSFSFSEFRCILITHRSTFKPDFRLGYWTVVNSISSRLFLPDQKNFLGFAACRRNAVKQGSQTHIDLRAKWKMIHGPQFKGKNIPRTTKLIKSLLLRKICWRFLDERGPQKCTWRATCDPRTACLRPLL